MEVIAYNIQLPSGEYVEIILTSSFLYIKNTKHTFPLLTITTLSGSQETISFTQYEQGFLLFIDMLPDTFRIRKTFLSLYDTQTKTLVETFALPLFGDIVDTTIRTFRHDFVCPDLHFQGYIQEDNANARLLTIANIWLHEAWFNVDIWLTYLAGSIEKQPIIHLSPYTSIKLTYMQILQIVHTSMLKIDNDTHFVIEKIYKTSPLKEWKDNLWIQNTNVPIYQRSSEVIETIKQCVRQKIQGEQIYKSSSMLEQLHKSLI